MRLIKLSQLTSNGEESEDKNHDKNTSINGNANGDDGQIEKMNPS